MVRARKLFETGMMSPSDLARAELEVARLEAGGDQKQVREIEIDAARRQLTDAKRRVEMGVLPPGELLRLEADLARLLAGNDVNKLFAMEVEAARRDYEAKNTLFEKGLISERHLRESQALINRLEQNRHATDRERVVDESQRAEVEKLMRELRERSGQSDAQRKEIERVLELRDRGLARTLDRKQDEIAALIAENEQRKSATERDRQREMEEVAARMRDLERRLSDVAERRARSTGEPRPEAYDEVAPRAIVAGDLLSIVISGESELPMIYRIDSNGAIRIPLLGTFKVVGQTPDQLRQAIGRKLSDSRLGSAGSVRVSIRRTRPAR